MRATAWIAMVLLVLTPACGGSSGSSAGVIWRDADGKQLQRVVGTTGNLALFRVLFEDERGLVWGVSPGDGTVSIAYDGNPFVQLFSSSDCSGQAYLSGIDGQPIPGFTLRIGQTDPIHFVPLGARLEKVEICSSFDGRQCKAQPCYSAESVADAPSQDPPLALPMLSFTPPLRPSFD